MPESGYEEIFKFMREDINNAKNQGLETFTSDQLFAWVAKVEIALKDINTDHTQETIEEANARVKREHDYKVKMTEWVEEVKHINATNLEQTKFAQEGQLETFRGAIKFAEIALKSSILINGGAAVAFLAFIGTLWTGSNENPESLLKLAGPLMMFVWGVLVGAISCGLAYLTQICYSEGAPNWVPNTLRVFCVITVVGTYVCFYLGAIDAHGIFSGTPK